MLEQFWQDLSGPDSLLRLTVLAVVLASVACGVMGSYVVARRCSYMVGAVSHSLLGGIGLALLCQRRLGMDWFTPLWGALLAALLAAVLISVFSLRGQRREDTMLSAIWALGMALGLSCIFAMPGYPVNLNSYLFGNILLVTPQDLKIMAVLDVIILVLVWLFHTRFLCLCFHEEGLRLRGVNADLFLLLLNLLLALTVVMLAQIAGVILCLALMILPSATAAIFCHRLPAIMLLGGIFCLLSSLAGLMLSYAFNLPTGATIVEISGGIYLLTVLGAACRQKFFCSGAENS
jgi:zinc transport system permease protein